MTIDGSRRFIPRAWVRKVFWTVLKPRHASNTIHWSARRSLKKKKKKSEWKITECDDAQRRCPKKSQTSQRHKHFLSLTQLKNLLPDIIRNKIQTAFLKKSLQSTAKAYSQSIPLKGITTQSLPTDRHCPSFPSVFAPIQFNLQPTNPY